MKSDKILKIGLVLKRLIKSHATSIRRLSNELSIPKTTLFNYTQGIMPMKPEYILRLCQKFNITADELLFDIPRITKEIRCGDLIEGTFRTVELGN